MADIEVHFGIISFKFTQKDVATVLERVSKWIAREKHRESQEIQFAGRFHIVNRNSGKALDIKQSSQEDGAPLVQFKPHFDGNQTWNLVRRPNDRYVYIFADHSGKCLDVDVNKHDDLATVWQYKFHGGANQQWKIEPTPDGWFQIVARHSGKALDVYHSSLDDLVPVIQFGRHNGHNQQWKLLIASC